MSWWWRPLIVCSSQIRLTGNGIQWSSSAPPRSSTEFHFLSVGFARNRRLYRLHHQLMQRLCQSYAGEISFYVVGSPFPIYLTCKEYSIYGVRRTIVGPSLFIWPAQITQLYASECPSNTVDCLTLQIQLTKTYNRLFLANPTVKYASQWSSEAEPRSSTGLHICQLDLLAIADYIVFVSWTCNVCAHLRC